MKATLTKGASTAAALCLLALPAAAQFTFAPTTSYPVGPQPRGIAAGDFDGDGDMDLATTSDSPARVMILLNDGLGGFVAGPVSNVPGFSSPQDLIAGAFDGDSIVDLAVALRDPQGSVILMCGVGGATFTYAGSVPVGDAPGGLSAADTDDDLDLDIAVANRDSASASCLRNLGCHSYAMNAHAVGGEARGTTFGDLNGDGYVDLAVTNFDDDTVSLFSGDVSGFDEAAAIFAMAPDGVAASDFDVDDDMDLAVATESLSGSNQVTILLGTGDFNFFALHYPAGGSNGSAIVITDLDLDGAPDVAMANEGSANVSLLRNEGGGSFDAAQLIAAGTTPSAMVAMDLDGDGDIDLATANRDSNDVSVMLNELEDPQPSCPEDVDDSGVVGFSDLTQILLHWGTCPEECPADVDGNGVVGFLDLVLVLVAWGACDGEPLTGSSATAPESLEIEEMGVCCLGNGAYVVTTSVQCDQMGGSVWISTANTADSDGDRIPDVFEANNCVTNGCFIGTDPAKADTDGDSIKDGDEAFGTTAGLNLPAMGANPCRKDIFIETDWVYKATQAEDRNRPHANQIARVVTAFANAPITNPNGVNGIALHIDYAQGGGFTRGNTVLDNNGVVDTLAETLDGGEYYLHKNGNETVVGNFDVNRRGYFHYCLMCDEFSIAGTVDDASGLAEVTGDDFMVAWGSALTGDHDFIGNTIMHEFGHNLGLRHGGDEGRNRKPNYNSVMNYRYQSCGIDNDSDAMPNGVLDYSKGARIALDENKLGEAKGVTGEGPGIDWNGDGDATDVGLARNVNCKVTNGPSGTTCGPYTRLHKACGTGTDCDDATCDVLKDHNDWCNLKLNGLSTDPAFGGVEIIYCNPGS